MVGGVASAKPATEETQNLICKVKAEMELQAGRSFDVFEAVSVASQVGGKGIPRHWCSFVSHSPQGRGRDQFLCQSTSR